MKYFVYILTTKNNLLFYIGVTKNLDRRILEHKSKLILGFTAKFNINKLVYYEEYNSIRVAIRREKQLKNWHRQWKINLIKEYNKNFIDLLYPETSSG